MVKLFGKDFGKRKDDFLDPGVGVGGTGVPGPAAEDFPALPATPPDILPAASPSVGGEKIEALSRSVELLSSKLDAIKSSLDALNQRIANIESSLKQQSQPSPAPQQETPYFPSAPTPEPQAAPTEEDKGWHY